MDRSKVVFGFSNDTSAKPEVKMSPVPARIKLKQLQCKHYIQQLNIKSLLQFFDSSKILSAKFCSDLQRSCNLEIFIVGLPFWNIESILLTANKNSSFLSEFFAVASR
jgi:hypothetical protein